MTTDEKLDKLQHDYFELKLELRTTLKDISHAVDLMTKDLEALQEVHAAPEEPKPGLTKKRALAYGGGTGGGVWVLWEILRRIFGGE